MSQLIYRKNPQVARVATHDPGRMRDFYGFLGAAVDASSINLLNARTWHKTDFTKAEDEIADIQLKHPFDYHFCETNNQGWHVIDNLRRYHKLKIRGVNTGANIVDPVKLRSVKTMDKPKTIEWVEWARDQGIIKFPKLPWSPGIKKLNNQLEQFVAKYSRTGVKYEAADEDTHDDLVMCLLILCHVARRKFLRLGGSGIRLQYGGTGLNELLKKQTPQQEIENMLKKKFKDDHKQEIKILKFWTG